MYFCLTIVQKIIRSTITVFGTSAPLTVIQCCRQLNLFTMEEKFEKLGLLIDSLDNLAHALKLPLPPQMHVEQIGIALPEKVKELKEVYVEITGENPWD